MSRELRAAQVTARLVELRAQFVPETLAAGAARLARERPRPVESFDRAAARALAELRALCELARHLHRAR